MAPAAAFTMGFLPSARSPEASSPRVEAFLLPPVEGPLEEATILGAHDAVARVLERWSLAVRRRARGTRTAWEATRALIMSMGRAGACGEADAW